MTWEPIKIVGIDPVGSDFEGSINVVVQLNAIPPTPWVTAFEQQDGRTLRPGPQPDRNGFHLERIAIAELDTVIADVKWRVELANRDFAAELKRNQEDEQHASERTAAEEARRAKAIADAQEIIDKQLAE